jgi:hypothetical protein
MRAIGACVTLLLMAACAVHQPGGGGNGPLLPSLQATAMGDSVFFVLQVTNTGEAPVDLHFRSGQSYDFAVLSGDREVWRWSDGQMFTQALRHERLEAGQTLRFEEAWRPGAGVSGNLIAVGRLPVQDRQVEQRANFRLP